LSVTFADYSLVVGDVAEALSEYERSFLDGTFLSLPRAQCSLANSGLTHTDCVVVENSLITTLRFYFAFCRVNE